MMTTDISVLSLMLRGDYQIGGGFNINCQTLSEHWTHGAAIRIFVDIN